ncbi:SNF-related serine/threonine-protein kinase-like isoform X1 [Lates japonicus]|uniref:SNF-related serine/threonine-protein kinase-like isoform X1 n=1 Tax=Lates japonicus TaxID=270547 RepID=A0AAD3MPJ6_LATJO|nr:SNF-related serine/threonine-protein kinase-like isoform X1 [Lates japonicus]
MEVTEDQQAAEAAHSSRPSAMAGLTRAIMMGRLLGYDLDKTLGVGTLLWSTCSTTYSLGKVRLWSKTKAGPSGWSLLFPSACMMVQHPSVRCASAVIDHGHQLCLVTWSWEAGGDMYGCIMKHDGGLSEERPEARKAWCFEKQASSSSPTWLWQRFQPGKKLQHLLRLLAYSAPEILLGGEYDAPAVACQRKTADPSFSAWCWGHEPSLHNWALESNQYNHITATYFLLAERMLRERQEKEQHSQTRSPSPSKAQFRQSNMEVDVHQDVSDGLGGQPSHPGATVPCP